VVVLFFSGTLWALNRLMPGNPMDESKPATAAHQDEDESVEPRTFTLDQVRAMIRSGEIVDMKTALGLTLIQTV